MTINLKYSFFSFSIFFCLFTVDSVAYDYVKPSPVLGDDSLYTFDSLTAEEYEEQFGKSEVFADAEIVEKDNIVYHYYKYAQKPDTASSKPIISGNGGLDVHGGWYAKFGTFDGQAINLRSGSLGHIYGDFINNGVDGSSGYGGALFMERTTIKEITGDFINNHIGGYMGNGGDGVGNAYGGAMYVHNYAKISDGITGNFINNYISGGRYVMGGAIDNDDYSTISSIDGKFIGNHIMTRASAYAAAGGAIYNTATIGDINADFVYNHIQSEAQAVGGAIHNNSKITSIKGNFIDNYISAQKKAAQGGAVSNKGTIGSISGNFIANHASMSDAELQALGGAIYTTRNLNFINVGQNYFFSNNYTEDSLGKQYNSIFVETGSLSPTINFSMVDKATYIINDSINGGSVTNSVNKYGTQYKTIFDSSDNSGTVFLADHIINSDISLKNISFNIVKYEHSDGFITKGGFGNDETARSSLTIDNSVLGLHNNYYDSLFLHNYTAGNNAVLHLNVGKQNENWVADTFNISGDIIGNTDVIIYTLNKDNNVNASVVFVNAPNDKIGNDKAFSVSRVYGSPYMWTAVRNYKGETSGSIWYLVGNTVKNPNTELPAAPTAPEFIPVENDDPIITPPADNKPSQPAVRPLYPEVIAGMGLHEAAIEQNRSVVRNVRNKVADGRIYCPNCGIYSAEWDGQKLRNIWVTAQGETATIDKPVKMDADIWGVEAGFDVQSDVNNTLGVFASYRKGEYDLSGKADKVRSNIGSEIDIDSYLAGLYYRYDKNMNWLFATVYGGIQQADAKTNDGIAKFDTDGVEFGASVEAGHSYELSDNLILEPSLGLYYTQINFDDAKDNVGKEYSWKDIKHIEAELGAKLEKQIDTAKIYIKPSIIQTVTGGDSVKVTGLNKLSTYDDGTLGRIELGGRYGFTDALSAYGWVNYTFGSDYDATAFGLGVNYSW
uniref:Autotransporter domain-containing protein n=1 Tax=uncultured Alphaproteobacteria bacterium TaxID=91750 RepID=A0A6M4NND8_9PROT|nr:hypothetical protein PlAlph_1960 [uncultured Alphaproteobacteria bacterium]